MFSDSKARLGTMLTSCRELMLQYGLQQHPQDPCRFWMVGSGSTPPLILVLFVNDIRLAGPGDAPERFIAYLQSTHKCTSKTQGEYLSMTFDDPLGGMIKAHRLRYSTDILNDLAMSNCIPRLSPLPGGRTLLEADESELLPQDAAAWYRTGVGKIGYLLQTKPDLCFAFSELSRHLIKPGKRHLEALEHVISRRSSTSSATYPNTTRRALRSSATSSRYESQPTQTATTLPTSTTARVSRAR
jgi:hypothetical protein